MKKIWIASLVICITLTTLVLDVVAKDNEISETEKRKLQMFPTLSLKDFFSGDLSNDLNDYSEDQFFIKDGLSRIKSWVSYNLFKNPVNNNIYVVDNVMYDMVYPIDDYGVNNFTSTVSNFQNMFKNPSNVVIIPEKSMYLSDSYLRVDVNDLDEQFADFDFMYDLLSVNNYYKTDLHLNHLGSYEVYNSVVGNYGFIPIGVEFEKVTDDFKGFYSNKSMDLSLKDEMFVARNEIIDNLEVCHLGSNADSICQIGPYYTEHLEDADKYEMYLDGTKPVTVITNEAVLNGELVIFSDSYGTSIAPFLAQHFNKVTIIDLRLINISMAGQYLSEDANVLYLYGYKTIHDTSSGA